MIKYLVLSTIIVFGIATGVAAWVNRDLIRIKIASVYAAARARPGAAAHSDRGGAAPLVGDAPWVLSALPECLLQTSKSSGSRRYVRAHLPARAVRVVPPARLTYGDCTIAIAGDEAFVRRGGDRLRIPPSVAFYRAARSLATIREANGTFELRVYEPVRR